MNSVTGQFDVCEASICSTQRALHTGATTCSQLAHLHLARIEAYDDAGPVLRAMIAINPRLMEEAAALDRIAPETMGPLHGVTVVLKDNVDMLGMSTTGGVPALARAMPRQDAYVTARLRAAGALIVGKANLHDFALGGLTVSSIRGQTRNPYDSQRTPGGSSGGTGVAVAASFALVGIGTDTGQSVRSPASALNLVGLRPTRGAVSRAGVMPTSVTQDTVGPMARTAEDLAQLLNVIVGFDPRDEASAACAFHLPPNFTSHLLPQALAGVRIGVVHALFGRGPQHDDVNRIVRLAAALMSDLGAELVDIEIPGLESMTSGQATSVYEMGEVFDQYLTGLDSPDSLGDLASIFAGGEFHPSVTASLRAAVHGQGTADPEYAQIFLRRARLRDALLFAMARQHADVLLYPHQRVLVAQSNAAVQPERNGVLSNATGMPAICFPAGFSAATADAPLGVPVGVEFLGPDWSEARLIGYAHAFEQAYRVRAAPLVTPPL